MIKTWKSRNTKSIYVIKNRIVAVVAIMIILLLFTSCKNAQNKDIPKNLVILQPESSTIAKTEEKTTAVSVAEREKLQTTDPTTEHEISMYEKDELSNLGTSSYPVACQVGKKIYFTNFEMERRELFSMDLDGGNAESFHNIRATLVFSFNDWIYYINPEKDYALYKVDLEGKNKSFVYYCDFADVRYSNGYFYWTEFEDFQIMRLNLLTGEVTDLEDFMTDDFSITGDLLYARKANDNQIIEINLKTGLQTETSCYGRKPLRIYDSLYTFFFRQELDSYTIHDYNVDGSSKLYKNMRYPEMPTGIDNALVYKDNIILGAYKDGIYIYETENMTMIKKIPASPGALYLLNDFLFILQADGVYIYDLNEGKFILTPIQSKCHRNT